MLRTEGSSSRSSSTRSFISPHATAPIMSNSAPASISACKTSRLLPLLPVAGSRVKAADVITELPYMCWRFICSGVNRYRRRYSSKTPLLYGQVQLSHRVRPTFGPVQLHHLLVQGHHPVVGHPEALAVSVKHQLDCPLSVAGASPCEQQDGRTHTTRGPALRGCDLGKSPARP